MSTGTLVRDDHGCAARRRPPVLRALGTAEPPEEIEVRGCRLRRIAVFKHDSWAATALYQGEGHRIVCKFNRSEPIFGIPMKWLGRALARREARVLKLLADEPRIPDACGTVRVNGRKAPNAVAHQFISGRPLHAEDVFDSRLFEELNQVVQKLHGLGLAYLDLHKRENILLGTDGRPYLIDFQISVQLPPVWPTVWLLRLLQETDRYHIAKHRYRHIRSTAGVGESPERPRRPWAIQLHRMLTVPLRTLRRRLLVQAGVRTGTGKAHTEFLPEISFREAA